METNQNATPAKQSETGLVTGNIRKLLKDFPLIRNLKNDVPIEQALAYCFVLTGLKQDNYPDKLQRPMLINFVRDRYPGLVAAEIKRAFDMACSGQLDCETNHYQNFSCAYFGQVMGAYVSHRADELAQTKPEKEWSQEEFDLLKDWTERLIVPVERGEFKFSNLDYLWYDRLKELGIRCCQPEEMATFGDKAREITKPKKRMRLTDQEETKDEYNARVIKAAKCLAFQRWVEVAQFEETDLRKLIIPLINQR